MKVVFSEKLKDYMERKGIRDLVTCVYSSER
jgi:hypothetical protein